MILKVYKSDAWDEGNHLTQFYEIHETCPKCNGEGWVYDCEEDDWVECPVCDGRGEIVYYE